MTRTMWIAVFCLVALGASIAIRIVWPPASVLADTSPHQNKIATGPGPNEVAKSDRLELPSVHAEADETVAVPPAPPVLVETPPSKPATVKDSQPPAALARCQRQDRSVRTAASSPSHSQRDKKGHGQQPTGGKSRSLALPAGCHGQPFEVVGPFAKMNL